MNFRMIHCWILNIIKVYRVEQGFINHRVKPAPKIACISWALDAHAPLSMPSIFQLI